jgi:hypothetical protein
MFNNMWSILLPNDGNYIVDHWPPFWRFLRGNAIEYIDFYSFHFSETISSYLYQATTWVIELCNIYQ